MIDKNGFGARLEKAMNRAGLNNKEITEILGLSKNSIGNYKNNQFPTAEILYKLSQILGITMEYLLTGKEIKDLTKQEQELLTYFRALEPTDQARELGRLEAKAEANEEKIRKTEQERLLSSRTG